MQAHEHYYKAERLLHAAVEAGNDWAQANHLCQTALVHATLALAHPRVVLDAGGIPPFTDLDEVD